MLQIFLIGSMSGISLIGCAKKKKVVRPKKKTVVIKVESVKKEESEKQKPLELYRNIEPSPIDPKAYTKLVHLIRRRFHFTDAFKNEGCVVIRFEKNTHTPYGKNRPTFTAFDANSTLNRYNEPKCIDRSRVVLENRKNDYINASWIICDKKAYRGKNILTQGPLKHTIPDFWAMIYQEKVEYIVMFCSFIENGMEQSAEYYPTKEGIEIYDNFEVKHVRKEKDPVEGVTWTVLHLIDKNGNETRPRRVNHVYVSWWPENTAPDDPKLTLELYKWLMKKNQSHIPMVFHCNNGIGRSATFAAIYFLLRLDFDDFKGGAYDEISHVLLSNIRPFRNGAIESPLQSTFFACCLMEYFHQEEKMEKDEDVEAFMSDHKKYAQEVRECVREDKPISIDLFERCYVTMVNPDCSCHECERFRMFGD